MHVLQLLTHLLHDRELDVGSNAGAGNRNDLGLLVHVMPVFLDDDVHSCELDVLVLPY